MKLIDAYVYESELWMICEQLEGGSLADAVALSGGFKEVCLLFLLFFVKFIFFHSFK